MIVTRQFLRHSAWEKSIDQIVLSDINVSVNDIKMAEYIVFIENDKAKILKFK